MIRILYNLSFVEGPTRIIRAIRFEQRYRFAMDADTLRFARDAIEGECWGNCSYGRILNELIMILNEKTPCPALHRMPGDQVWNYVFPEVDLKNLNWNDMRRIRVLWAGGRKSTIFPGCRVAGLPHGFLSTLDGRLRFGDISYP